MEQPTQGPSSARKRKLPSFMVNLEQAETPADRESAEVGSSKPPTKPKAPKKELRQSKLPLKKQSQPKQLQRERQEQALGLPSHLTHSQRAVLAISDALLVQECQAILRRPSAITAACNTASDLHAHTSSQSADQNQESMYTDANMLMESRAAPVDIMDMETQLLDVSPHPAYTAVDTLRYAPLPTRSSLRVDSAQLAQPRVAEAAATPELSVGKQLAGADVSQDRTTSAAATVSAPALAPLPSKAAVNMNSLLEAMLAGDL